MRSNGRLPIRRSSPAPREQREKLTHWLPEGMAFDTSTAGQPASDTQHRECRLTINRGRLRPAPSSERNHTMTHYIVHIYREMRLSFEDIEADTPEAAAAIARDKPTSDADDIEDCEGENLSALVDVAGDEEYAQSRYIDFESERQRKAAPKLLDTLKVAEGFVHWALDHGGDRQGTPAALTLIRNTIGEAEACGIRAEPSATRLLSALKAVLPYAENERASLEQCWGRDDDARIKEELDACDRALDQALALILESHAPGNNASGGRHEPR